MSRCIEVLDAATPDGYARWLELWSSWGNREVSAHPNYIKLFARPSDRALAITYRTGEGAVLFPLIQRPLAAEPWAGVEERARDLVSPYGYGGPFAWGVTELEKREFWGAFDAWARAENITTTFTRLSLFEEQLAMVPDAESNAPNVVRTLDLCSEDLWRDYAHKVRKNVNRARAAGVVVSVDRVGSSLDAFIDIYHSTMDRRNASQGYYFPREFFLDLMASLPGQFVFFHARHGTEIVSTELVLVSALHMYSFLGGTRERAFDLRPNDLLKHEAAEWGRGQGKRAFVLGGGYGGPDGIFKYKLAFAPRGEMTFRVAKTVHDPVTTQRLVETRRAWEHARGMHWTPEARFFPPYRG
jgi:hypothetical protein